MIRYGRALPKGVLNSEITGFINVYKEAFGGSPYFEKYTDEEVRAIWDEHISSGRIILAQDGNTVVGFGCSLPLSKAPSDVQDFLRSCKNDGLLPEDFSDESVWYMSELGVDESYRGRGIAHLLVRHRLLDVSHASKLYYVMRTATEKSNSRKLYEGIGAVPIPRTHDVSESAQVNDNGSQAHFRVYLWGKSSEAIHNIWDTPQD